MDYWELKIAKMYRIVFLLLSSVIFISCSNKADDSIDLPYYNNPDFTPIFITNKLEVASKIKHTIGDFSFLNQDSILIYKKVIEGKIHVYNFIFSKYGSNCPKITNKLII